MNFKNIMPRERSQTQKSTHCMKYLKTKTGLLVGCLGRGRGEKSGVTNRYGVSFSDDKNVIKLDCGAGCHFCKYKNH